MLSVTWPFILHIPISVEHSLFNRSYNCWWKHICCRHPSASDAIDWSASLIISACLIYFFTLCATASTQFSLKVFSNMTFLILLCIVSPHSLAVQSRALCCLLRGHIACKIIPSREAPPALTSQDVTRHPIREIFCREEKRKCGKKLST